MHSQFFSSVRFSSVQSEHLEKISTIKSYYTIVSYAIASHRAHHKLVGLFSSFFGSSSSIYYLSLPVSFAFVFPLVCCRWRRRIFFSLLFLPQRQEDYGLQNTDCLYYCRRYSVFVCLCLSLSVCDFLFGTTTPASVSPSIEQKKSDTSTHSFTHLPKLGKKKLREKVVEENKTHTYTHTELHTTHRANHSIT